MKFNPENKAVLTYGDIMNGAISVKTEDEAEQYLKDYVEYIKKFMNEPNYTNSRNLTAEQIAKENIGYGTGYYDKATSYNLRVLFKVSHPVFGMAKI